MCVSIVSDRIGQQERRSFPAKAAISHQEKPERERPCFNFHGTNVEVVSDISFL
ncbi:hypothetical protein [Roseicella aerolata]|uniref:Uncharacterized protein n=1 Tax=Roseicella aerolata TaxID=2883479 RepID=A0A9X1LAX3_9PROT|nr:hypothetical protein [Roseicella aerolata]MCB4825249.1 hypothetical protein [Roseicella aerolata]